MLSRVEFSGLVPLWTGLLWDNFGKCKDGCPCLYDDATIEANPVTNKQSHKRLRAYAIVCLANNGSAGL